MHSIVEVQSGADDMLLETDPAQPLRCAAHATSLYNA